MLFLSLRPTLFLVHIKVAEAQRFGFNEALWLMATGRATREALLSEAGFEKVFRTQNWVRRSKLFCRNRKGL